MYVVRRGCLQHRRPVLKCFQNVSCDLNEVSRLSTTLGGGGGGGALPLMFLECVWPLGLKSTACRTTRLSVTREIFAFNVFRVVMRLASKSTVCRAARLSATPRALPLNVLECFRLLEVSSIQGGEFVYIQGGEFVYIQGGEFVYRTGYNVLQWFWNVLGKYCS